MAEVFSNTIEFKGLNKAKTDFDKLSNSVDEFEKTVKKSGKSAGSLARDFNEVTDAAKKVVGTLRAGIGVISDLADAFERQMAVMNRFTGNVDEALRRTNGLITRFDAMAASATASQAGLTLSAQAMGDVAVAASEFAASTGGDATEALDKLTRALAQGEEGALREFGISLGNAKTQADRQRVALEQLNRQYGNAESSADTLAGKLQVLENRLADAATDMIRTANETGSLDRAFDKLEGSTTRLFEELVGLDDEPLSATERLAIKGAAFIEALAEEFEDFTEFVVAAKEALETLGQVLLENGGSVGDAFFDRRTLEAFARVGEAELDDRDTTLGDRVERITNFNTATVLEGRQQQAGADPRNPQTTFTRGSRESLDEVNKAELARKDLIQEQVRLNEELAENDAAKIEAASRLLELEKERTAEAQRQADLSAKAKLALLEELELENEAAELEKIKIAREADAAEMRLQTQEDLQRTLQRTQAGFDGIAEIATGTIDLLQAGNLSLKEAFQTSLDAFLRSFAREQGLKSGEAAVEAISLAFTNPPAAASKATAAVGHAALAAAAGGAAAAIPTPGGGGGAGGGATRPEAVGGGRNTGGGGGGTTIINFNQPVSQDEVGRLQARAEREARRRFGD